MDSIISIHQPPSILSAFIKTIKIIAIVLQANHRLKQHLNINQPKVLLEPHFRPPFTTTSPLHNKKHSKFNKHPKLLHKATKVNLRLRPKPTSIKTLPIIACIKNRPPRAKNPTITKQPTPPERYKRLTTVKTQAKGIKIEL